MIRTLITLCIGLLSHAAFAAEPNITFDATTYHLAFVKETPDAAINQYLPQGSTPENWTKMLALHQYKTKKDTTPTQFAEEMGTMIQKTNPEASYELITNDQTGEAVLDFLTWTQNKPQTSEFNIFKFTTSAPGRITGYQYSHRHNGPPEGDYLTAVKQHRNRLRNDLATKPYPAFVSESEFQGK